MTTIRRILTSKVSKSVSLPRGPVVSSSYSSSAATALAFHSSHVRFAHKYRSLPADDPFGEKASLASDEFRDAMVADIDPVALREKMDDPNINKDIFMQAELGAQFEVLRRSLTEVRKNKKGKSDEELKEEIERKGKEIEALMASITKAGLTKEEYQVLLAQSMTEEEQRVASTLQGGFTEWLSLTPADRERIMREYRVTERERNTREHWAQKSYSSYEEYIRREIIGVTADDVMMSGGGGGGGNEGSVADGEEGSSSSAAVEGREESSASVSASSNTAPDSDNNSDVAFEDDDDGLTSLDPLAQVPLPNVSAAAATTVADQTITDADAVRRELQSETAQLEARQEEALSAKRSQQEEGKDEASATSAAAEEEKEEKQVYHPDKPYKLPSTDPSRWNTEDVVAWLACFAEEGVMDDEMIKTFRMVHVDGDMLLNKVMPPNLFKIMRKWHLHRSNPKTRHLAEELIVEAEVVQYTIYLCFPYCGQMS